MPTTSPSERTQESDTPTGVGVDVGGTGIKVGRVDLGTGELVGDRLTRPTPQPATPDAVAGVIRSMVEELGWDGPVGVALPSVIHDGIARIAHNIDGSWVGCDVVALFAEHLPGRPVVMLNDADAAGITEVHYGAGEGVDGLVILLTFGTGIGSALLLNGHLIPNTEFGHLLVHDIDGRGVDEAEHLASAAVRHRDGLTYEQWAPHVSNVLRSLEDLLWPRAFVIGGAISEAAEEWFPLLENRTPVRVAVRRGDAGIIGAALYAAASTGLLDLDATVSPSDH
ncbi:MULTISPECIES: polyphosphate--glucose phosphotransferase [unclassified Dietzia]|uniref:polyphosphate--glucose phosphotransferase n=1 Tax=unclassified Dietzia TaxID=2617939 RepID=UPI000D210F07|nr:MULTISPECIES: ROK family protein [unclassified Dietzia]AVZ39353.1 polyphosphate glucokinase [Dietzia sp. JS16-p6b]MBB1024529.1 ROK family protein [Dietzia sp. DQ12-76]MBB1028498.1 ROK family protein [Dietzia sp. DQ11-38-2]QGW24612.1 polyphosphate glucokinase PpgK [Dietzia sp. DQ12-45-1b]